MLYLLALDSPHGWIPNWGVIVTLRAGFIGLLMALAGAGTASAATLSKNEYTNSSYLALIGVTPTLQASANYGQGIVFGVIDTGALASQADLAGGVDTADSACTITGSTCPNSYAITDNNGHGTFVTSEMIARANGYGVVGVAPLASAIEMKVLNASGSGTTSSVAAGIKLAADRGAQILNLSLTFLPTSDILAAINYAASKNVIIVFAGGNSSQAFQNNALIRGLTDQAIKQLFFMGSTSAIKVLSSFSNTAGTGGFVSTTGQVYYFKDHWLMADGENLWGASNYCSTQYGCTYYTQMSGTSMAAPQGAAAVGLLAARWPFLLNTNPGGIVSIMMQTAQDLGVTGHDKTYGSGFLRVDLAFQPVGQLALTVSGGVTTTSTATTTLSGGRTVGVSGTAVGAGGPVGNLSGLTRALSGIVAFDDYHRDFGVDLGSTVLARRTGSVVAPFQALSVDAVQRTVEFSDGARLSYSGEMARPMFDPAQGARREGFADSPLRRSAPRQWSISMTNDGAYTGAGEGSGAAMSFSEARWIGTSAFRGTDAEASTSLLGLVADTHYATTGFNLRYGERISFASLRGEDASVTPLGNVPDAYGFAAAYTFLPQGDPAWQVSLTATLLDESQMLLGSPSGGGLSFGRNGSTSVGVATNFNLGSGYQLGFDAVTALTKTGTSSSSIISGMSDLRSVGFGAVLAKTGVAADDDSLTFTLRKPLRVVSGSATLNVATGNDLWGNAVMERRSANLVPTGNETDFGATYDRMLFDGVSASLHAGARMDAEQVAGALDLGSMLQLRMTF